MLNIHNIQGKQGYKDRIMVGKPKMGNLHNSKKFIKNIHPENQCIGSSEYKHN